MNSQDLRSLLADRAESVDTHRPDRVDEIHVRIHTARRRRTAAIAGAAAVVAALAIAAVTLPDTVQTQEPVDRPTDGISTLRPETDREIQDRLTSDNPQGLLDPGTYVVDVDGLRPRPVVDLPKGFRFETSPDLAALVRFARRDCTISTLACRRTPLEPSGPSGALTVGFWNGEKIMVSPDRHCAGGDLAEYEQPGPSVDDLAAALADLPGFRATAPAPVSLGGYGGLYVELVINAPMCPAFWITGLTSEDPYQDNDAVLGHVERLWILDVEGGRIVVEATNQPGATEEQIAELTSIVESVRFTDTE